MYTLRSLFGVVGVVGIAACCMPDCASLRPPAAVPPATTEPAAAASPEQVPAAATPPPGRWPTNDVPEPDPSFRPAEVLNLPKALWGIDIPNLLKGVGVAWDGKTGRIYAMGIATDRLTLIDPAVPHPVGAIDLDVKTHTESILVMDEAHRRLYVVTKGDGGVRAVDLDKGELVARADGPRGQRPNADVRGFSVKGAAVDPKTGWLWVADLGNAALTGYSPDLQTTKVASGFSGPSSVAFSPTSDEMLVVDGTQRDALQLVRYNPSTDTIVSSTAIPSAAGPTAALYAPDGSVMFAGRALVSLGADGAPRWKMPLGAHASSVAFLGDTVAVLLGDPAETVSRGPRGAGGPGGPGAAEGAGGPGAAGRPGGRGGGERGGGERPAGGPPGRKGGMKGPPAGAEEPAVASTGPERQVLLIDLATGTLRGTVAVGFEAHTIAADTKTGRIFCGNGGDGSVAIIDVASQKVTSTIDVGNAAEEVVVDEKTGDRYVLNRLGGSVVYRWAKGAATVDTWAAGKWPSDLTIDPERRRLWALGHYESTILGWDLATRAPLPPITLGLAPNHGDSLGDMDYDPAVGLAGVVFPESGSVAVVDPMAGTVLWTRVEKDLAVGPEAGPGNGFVAVDGKNQRLYVVGGRGASVRAYDLKTGDPVGSLTLEAAERTSAYNVNGALLDRASGRLFVGPQVVKVPALTAGPRIDGIGKVFWADDHALLAIVSDGERNPERLLQLDPKTFDVKGTWPLVRTGMMRLVPTYVASEKRVYAADMAEARVLAWDFTEK